MEKIQKILAPTDLSLTSRVGVEHALKLGRIFQAEVLVYHVVSPDDLIQGYRRMSGGKVEYAAPSDFQPLRVGHEALSRFLNTHFASLLEDIKGEFRPDPVNVPDRILDPLFRRNVNTRYAWHNVSP